MIPPRMGKLGQVGSGSAGGSSAGAKWILFLAAAAAYWFDPSSGVSTALLWGTGLLGVWRLRQTRAAWRNPAGLLFGLGALAAALSMAWSFHPAGTARDLVKSAPMALAAFALPGICDRPGRIWAALVASAGLVTARVGVDLARLVAELGWPEVLTAARFHHPYLYTHPNAASMMAGLCILVFAARGLAGAPGAGWKALLAAGIVVDLAYLEVMASRGPQIAFAVAALAFPAVLLPGGRARLAALGLALALGFGLWRVAGDLNPRFRDRTMATFNERDKVWKHAKALADQRPVWGYGFGKKTFEKVVYDNPEQPAPALPFHYPHAHNYWMMLYFQGGAAGFGLWSLGWLALAVRLGRFARRAEPAAGGRWARLQARILPALLGTSLFFILLYGVGDFPDHAIRHAQFYLLGLALALTAPPRTEAAPAP